MNNTTQQAIKANSIDQAMRKGDWSQWVIDHKGLVVSAVVGLALAILLAGVFYQKNKEARIETAESLSSFRATYLDINSMEINEAEPQASLNKKLAPNVVTDFQELAKKHSGIEGVAALGLELSDLLLEEQRGEESFQVIKTLLEQKPSKSSLTYFMLTIRHAVLLENLDRLPEATVALESLLNFPLKIMQDKLYFDLARLYLLQGNSEKARANFQYVLDKTESKGDFKKLAKIELQKLKN